MPNVEQVKGSNNTFRVTLDQLDQGWSTRSFPHLISDRQLYVADNVIFNRDGLVSKRPGNITYGKASGATGSGRPILSMARFYQPGQAPQLIVQSGGNLYAGNDNTGAFTLIGGGVSTTTPCHYEQVYDPDLTGGAAVGLFICDGTRRPYVYNGAGIVAVQVGTPFLPNNQVTSVPLQPRFVKEWKYNLCLAGDPYDPSGLYIGDALRPERFTGISLTDSSGQQFLPYYPAGRNGNLGVITGVKCVGPNLVVFYTSGIVIGYNTGTYGSFEFEWNILSSQVGCPSPESIIEFGGYIVFFGGDRFYATDSQTVVPLSDEIPSVYSNTSASTFPSEIQNKTTVVGARRGLQYLAGYDSTGAGPQTSVVCFDMGAAGGWTYGNLQGGAWSRFPTGMPLACGLECRGPGETTFPFYWGSSKSDLVAQWDTGNYDDFGAAISMEARAKAFFLDRPTAPKRVNYVNIVCAFPEPFGTSNSSYADVATPYCYTDSGQQLGNVTALGVLTNVATYDSGVTFDSGAVYGGGDTILTVLGTSFVQQDCIGNIFQPGVMESSTNPFNLLAFVVEVTIDEPQ